MTHQLRIGRLRLELSEADEPTSAHWHNRITAALGHADLAPTGLPPQAILIVRQLHDPADGTLLDGVFWQAGRKWGQQVQPILQENWRRAARPILESVGANAVAVWFLNRAEWLACLTSDLHRGLAHQRWWWQTALQLSQIRQAPSPIAAVWELYPVALPQAIALLNEQSPDLAYDIIASVPQIALRRLCHIVAQTYQLPPPAVDSLVPHTFRQHIPHKPRQIPESPADTYQRWAFLLGLYYAPTALKAIIAAQASIELAAAELEDDDLARLPAYSARGSKALDQAATTASDDAPTRPERTLPKTAQESHYARTIAKRSPRENPERSLKAEPYLLSSTVAGALESAQTTRPREQANIPQIPQSIALAATELDLDIAAADDTTYATPPAVPPPAEPVATKLADGVMDRSTLATMHSVSGINTQLGGLWFMVNVLILMDLLERGYSLWAILDSLGRQLLTPQIPGDPVWTILATLAQQDGLPQLPDEATLRWTATMLPSMQSWLRDGPSELTDYPGTLQKPATLHLSGEQIDVVFSVEQIDIQCRIAGLDRDPGWLPELSCAIRFHFW